MLRNIEDVIKIKRWNENSKWRKTSQLTASLLKPLNLFNVSSSPALAELLGLQDESSYGQLLRTMPRGLKEEWTSMSHWGRQSLLPLALSVSDTANRNYNLKSVFFLLCAQLSPEVKSHDWNALMLRNQKEWIISGGERSRKRKGKSRVAARLPTYHFLEGTVDRNIRCYQIRLIRSYWQELQSLSFLSSLSGAASGALGSPLRTSSLESEL